MKGSLADWRKMTLAGMRQQHASLIEQRDVLAAQIEDLYRVVTSLEKLQLTSKLTRKAREDKPATGKVRRKSGKPHWTQLPKNRARVKAILKAATKRRSELNKEAGK